MKRTKAETLRIARNRADACDQLVKEARRLRPHLEAIRAECAEAGDLDGLEGCAAVSDTLTRWEGYDRRAARWRRIVARLRGAA